MKKILGILALITAIIFLPQTDYSQELLTNGSFETGNFTGWTVNSTQTSNYCTNWLITTNSGLTCLFPSQPNDGTFVAINGFDGSGGEFTIYQDVAIPALMSARLTFMFRAQWSIPTSTNLPRKFEVQIRDPVTNNLLETVYTFTANSGAANQNSGWITQQIFIPQFAGQTVRLYFVETIPQSFTDPGQFEIDGVKLEAFPPTAASVEVKGQVLNSAGRGVSRVYVTITDGSGQRKTTLTNPFGNYQFNDVAVGESYLLEVNHKSYFFPDNPRVLFINENLDNVIFRAGSIGFERRIE
jgi:hypothetical protein